MFGAMVLILLVLWALGVATGYLMSGFIHILLAVAVVALLVRVIQRRHATVARE